MNKPTLRLNEVLWEFCLTCNKNCKYCGSKDVLNRDGAVSYRTQLEIASKIAGMQPKNVTFTGGEPTTNNRDLIECAARLRHDHKIEHIGVVTNGIAHFADLIESDLFDAVGVSINILEDIKYHSEEIDEHIIESFGPGGKTTIITNVGTHNIFDVHAIFDFVKDVNGFIQIQLTMGEYQLNASGIKYLYQLIREHLFDDKNSGYILSDNLQHCHDCQAGLTSCSITSLGDVTPCLSQRAWLDDIVTYGNILDESFEDIWQTKFKAERFTGCECCRDQIDYPEISTNECIPDMKKRGDKFVEEDKESQTQTTPSPLFPKDWYKLHPITHDDWTKTPPFDPYDGSDKVVMYAVITPYESPTPQTYTYAVVKPYEFYTTTNC